ncbi:hypothetical protein AB0J86_26310 [Micromonospora sp. NPDC049559]|uniref:hypothetical protein n=1 Tax=Micromonospora sp. NPDC049559 TaxID=3155923 RepID=UPI003445C9D1
MTLHHPVRPGWTCTWCERDWPCDIRRTELRHEFTGALTSLAVYLTGCLADAATDLRHIPAGWLHNRFLGWLPLPGPPRPTSATDILLRGYELARAHTPDDHGNCPTCGLLYDCWVRLPPDGPGLPAPLPPR